jgi:hypothetical protein
MFFVVLQNADTYAVCTNCTKLSQNLQFCDHCGGALSAENSKGCYSSEPKRARTDAEAPSPTPTNGTYVNGKEPTSNNSSPDTTEPVPVPQALYKNKNAVDSPSFRQRAVFPTLTTTTLAVSSPLPSLVAATASNSSSASSMNPLLSNNIGLDSSNISTVGSTGPVAGLTRQPMPSVQRFCAPNYNLQPQGPIQYPLSSAQRPVEASSVMLECPPNQVAPPGNNSPAAPNPHKLSIEDNCVSIPAQQIRIGSQKFKPITAVSFKDDGILFTLKSKFA